jgi:hypothetical protein
MDAYVHIIVSLVLFLYLYVCQKPHECVGCRSVASMDTHTLDLWTCCATCACMYAYPHTLTVFVCSQGLLTDIHHCTHPCACATTKIDPALLECVPSLIRAMVCSKDTTNGPSHHTEQMEMRELSEFSDVLCAGILPEAQATAPTT